MQMVIVAMKLKERKAMTNLSYLEGKLWQT